MTRRNSIDFDSLGDRMKLYEQGEAGRKFIPGLPVLARMDGRSFHSFTKGLERPYDKRMVDAMIETTKLLVEETGALIGYTQSDEITLVWQQSDPVSQLWFDGKIAKMVSQLGALTTLYFYRSITALIPEKANALPSFDARVWQVPSRDVALDTLLWREMDATKNSISMAVSTYYSHKELHGVPSSKRQELLLKKNINWNDYPPFFKRGTYVQRRTVLRKFHEAELALLPERHAARQNPGLTFERSDIRIIDMPPFSKVTNKEEVVFQGSEAKTL